MNQPPNSKSRLTLLRIGQGILGHLGYLLALVFVVITSLTVLLPLLPFPHLRRRLANNLLRGFLKVFALRYLPALTTYRIIECSGLDQLQPGCPAIYVANHRSSIDALLLLALLPPTSLLIKARHARKPGYACLVHFFDFVRMEAGAPAAIRQSINKCKTLLTAGMNLLIFPEGIRSSNSRLMPFADLAFRLAIELKVPIIPIVIHSDRPFLNRQPGSYFPHKPVQFRIRILAPIPTLDERDSHRLSDLVSRQMTAQLNTWDQAPPNESR